MGPEELFDLLTELDRFVRDGRNEEARRLVSSSPLGQSALDRGYVQRTNEGYALTKAGRTLLDL